MLSTAANLNHRQVVVGAGSMKRRAAVVGGLVDGCTQLDKHCDAAAMTVDGGAVHGSPAFGVAHLDRGLVPEQQLNHLQAGATFQVQPGTYLGYLPTSAGRWPMLAVDSPRCCLWEYVTWCSPLVDPWPRHSAWACPHPLRAHPQ